MPRVSSSSPFGFFGDLSLLLETIALYKYSLSDFLSLIGIIFPPSVMDTAPVSSETTIVTASVTSEKPMAAL